MLICIGKFQENIFQNKIYNFIIVKEQNVLKSINIRRKTSLIIPDSHAKKQKYLKNSFYHTHIF